MKMQIREILIFAAVDDQTITVIIQFKLPDQFLNGGEYIAQEIKIAGWVERAQTGDGFFGHQQDVQRVTWGRVVKGQKSVCLA